jgi:hypothetical protein
MMIIDVNRLLKAVKQEYLINCRITHRETDCDMKCKQYKLYEE